MTPPLTSEKWMEVVNQFEDRWHFKHCLGALDGKHVALKMLKKSVSIYCNFKRFYSIVLMAVVDADYKFLLVDAGVN